MSAAHIVFSHGNSFAASTYAVMLDSLRQRGFAVSAIDRYGHDPRYPVTNNWPHLVQQLADTVQALPPTDAQAHDGRGDTSVFLVGHSLGGIVSLMCAAQHPHKVRGVVLIDAPVLGGWRAAVLALSKRLGLTQRYSPGRISQHRRHQWPSLQAVHAHFAAKAVFARWHPQVLADYAAHGTTDHNGQRQLHFDRDIETHIYNSLPDHLGQLLRQHPLTCPVAFVGASQSAEMRQVGMHLTRRITQGRISVLDGSHLIPMEKPLACAAAIEAHLRNMGA